MNDICKTELTNDADQNIEHIGVSDDSGFASISGSVAGTESTLKLVEDIKVENEPSPTKRELQKERKRKREEEEESKRLAAAKYNQDVRDQRYKRLMHLLDRSQFYSSYLVQKIDQSLKKEPKKAAERRRSKVSDENSPPTRRATRPKREKNVAYDIRDYVSIDEVKEKATDRKQQNLSQEEITSELSLGVEDTEVSDKVERSRPLRLKYFVGELRDYQIEGLKWLRVLYENGVNGILADEMGLGKTIQVIALICHLVEKKIPGPYLIIAPLSTIPNWLMEWENFAPKIPVVLLHGPPEERSKVYPKVMKSMFDVDGYKTKPVVLTTFEVPVMEANFLKRQQWRYIVIDEGHRIKNHQCQLLQVLKKCQSMNRLLLTGTPLQNNLSELWSLLNFLLPEIFNDLAVFESWFDAKELQNDEGTRRILKQEAEKKVLSSLREILKPFMLRRVKADVCLEIPAKKEMIVYAPLTELQHSLYTAVLNRDIATMNKIEEESLIIPEVNGERPKRRCRLRKDATYYMPDYSSDSSSSRASTPVEYEETNAWKKEEEEEEDEWKKDTSVVDGALSMWKQYTNLDDRNREFFVRIQFRNRTTMYKKIVNHPYLVHCPLNDAGLPKIDDGLIKSSGKLMVLDAMLAKLKARGHKVLLFSTMTMILDMIEDYLGMRDFKYVRLDGGFGIEERKINIKAFNSDPNIFLFLISTRAGGVGLNLTAADTVIIYDSDWNPQMDIQAMARCHRIGQTRPVVVYKLCTKGTIDETVLSRAEAKRKLEKMVISKDVMSLNLNNVDTLMQLKKLLESNDNLIASSENDVFTDKELDDILDRSDLMPKNVSDVSARNRKKKGAASVRKDSG